MHFPGLSVFFCAVCREVEERHSKSLMKIILLKKFKAITAITIARLYST